MATLCDEFVRESTALLSVIHNIQDFLDERRSHRTYLVETNAFFDYIEESNDQIEEFVTSAGTQLGTMTDTTLARTLLDVKALLAVVIRWYSLIRQVSDADTLSIPFPLIAYINNSLMALFPSASPLNKAKILPLAANELNYHQMPLDKIEKSCKDCTIIRPFPSNIGIIAFPYTERASVLLNPMLFHELGHFVFQRNNSVSTFDNSFKSLENTFESLPMTDLFGFDRPVTKETARSQVLNCCQELFADDLATRLVGPSYAIAIDRLFSLRGRSGDYCHKFTQNHPAPFYRKSHIAKTLDEMGWITTIEKVDSKANADIIALLQEDAKKEIFYSTEVRNPKISEAMINTFHECVPQVVALVK